MVEKVRFKKEDYPGYNQKRGDSAKCDQPFNLGACCTFKFFIGDIKKLKKVRRNRIGSISPLGSSKVHPWHIGNWQETFSSASTCSSMASATFSSSNSHSWHANNSWALPPWSCSKATDKISCQLWWHSESSLFSSAGHYPANVQNPRATAECFAHSMWHSSTNKQNHK